MNAPHPWLTQAAALAPLLNHAELGAWGGETGVLRSLFRHLPAQAGFAVEFGQKSMAGGTVAAWLRESGWGALYLDCDPVKPLDVRPARNGRAVTLAQARVRADNINALFRQHGVPEDLDILVIDIDGQDLWVWQAIDPAFRPSLVIIEFNAHIPLGLAASIQPDPDWRYRSNRDYGASFTALCALARQRGYRLVHIHGPWNLYFVRDDLALPASLCLPAGGADLTEAEFALLTDTVGFYEALCGAGRRPSWIEAPAPDPSRAPWQVLPPPGPGTREVSLDGLDFEVLDDKAGPAWYQQRKTYEEKASLLYPLLARAGITQFVDVGANAGLISLLARRALPGVRLLTLEADPRLLPVIRRNLARHGHADVEVVHALAGEQDAAAAPFSLNPANTLDNRVQGVGWAQVRVPQRRLDGVLARWAGPGRTFIKIDTQGYEQQVLRGLEPWLQANEGWLLKMEFAPQWLRSQGTDPAELLAHLQQRYEFVECPERIAFGTPDVESLFVRPLRERQHAAFLAHVVSLNRRGEGWVDLLVRPQA